MIQLFEKKFRDYLSKFLTTFAISSRANQIISVCARDTRILFQAKKMYKKNIYFMIGKNSHKNILTRYPQFILFRILNGNTMIICHSNYLKNPLT